MAYDSKTYGQSPFGNSSKPDGADQSGRKSNLPEAVASPTESGSEKKSDHSAAASPRLSDKFPTIPATAPDTAKSSGVGSSAAKVSASTGTLGSPAKPDTARKSRATTGKSTAKASKKSKTAKPAKPLVEDADQALAQRFFEEDRSAYLSLLYKTGISGLVWAVLRLSRHELSEQAVGIINTAINPLIVATVALIAVIALTFWLRYLLKDLAMHTQRLHSDAEMPDSKNFRPTLEIVGDALDYNPKLRKNLAILFNAASILICSLVSYLITSALLP
jgi:hypothetical protein